MNTLLSFILFLPVILLALTIHEFSHGYMAYKLGDPTAKIAGRLTLNPLSHIDPFGLILLLLIRIGWAKPVPVNPYYFKNPEKDMVLVALSGPASNFLTGGMAALTLRLLAPVLPSIIITILTYFSFISFVLCFFNLLPIPPLDGWRIASYFIKNRDLKLQIEQQGMWLLIAVLLIPSLLGINLLGIILHPLISFSFMIFLGHVPFVF